MGEIADWYDVLMNFAKPILICDENEEFRGLVREILTKNGFFHIVEASATEEALTLLQSEKEFFIIAHPALLNHKFISFLSHHRHFLILADNQRPDTVVLAAKLGVEHIISFPVHSRKLMDKMSSLI